MFNKISNNKLAIVFGVLLVIVLYFLLLDGSKNERSFRTDLVKIDTTKVSLISIFPKSDNGKEVKLSKIDGKWVVKISDTKSVSVPERKIDNLITQLVGIKSKRLASRDKEQWKNFQVDTAGTRVVVYEGSSKTLDIVIGKFSYEQQFRNMSTFVRLADETDVYEVDGFLAMTFNQDANSFRNNEIVTGDSENWKNVKFNYSNGGSFELNKLNNKWIANSGVELDSAKTVNYLRYLQSLNSSEFADDITKSALFSPVKTLSISTSENKEITLKSFLANSKEVLTSTQNTENVFNITNELAGKIFVTVDSLKSIKK